MASRLVVDGGRGIVISPVNLPSFVLGSSAAVTIGLVIFFLLTNTQGKGLLPILQHVPVAVQIFIVLLPLCAAVIVIFRMWSREQAARKTRVQNFSIRNVACTDERDRKPVYANIVNLLEDADHLAGTSPDQALDVFDRLARQKMPQAMDTSGLRLFHCWVIGLANLGRALDLLAVDIMARATARSPALRFCRSASQCIFLLPELMWFCESSTKRCLHLTGVAQAMYLLMVATVGVLLTTLWDFMNFWLMYEAEEKDVMVGVYVAVMALQALLVPALFRGPRRRASRRHRISCAESMQAVQRFRCGIDFTFGHGAQPATPPSISEEEPAPCRCRASSAPRVSGEMPLTRRVRHRRASMECTSDSCSGQRKGTAMDTCHVMGCLQVQEEHSPTSPLNATTPQVKHPVATHCLHQWEQE